MQIRHATPDDLSAVAEVILASLADDPSWKSLFPPGFRRDPAYDRYALDVLERYLSPENLDWLILVAEVGTTIVSVAIWDMSRSRVQDTWRRSSTSTVDSMEEHLLPGAAYPGHESETVMDKLASLSSAMAHSQEAHFSACGPYVYLEVLATHPAHRGHGHAKALCAVGVEAARKRDLAVAVLTGSRGYIFFSGLAFADLGCVAMREGAAEEAVLKVMVLRPRPKARRRSSVFDSFMSYVSLSTVKTG